MAQITTWDQAPVKSAATADPAAGADPAAVTVPAGKRWLILSWEATLVASGDAANRITNFIIKLGGTNVSFYSLNGLTITATQTKVQSFSAGGLNTAGTQYGLYFPAWELPAGATIQQVTTALQAADNWSAATYYYKELPA